MNNSNLNSENNSKQGETRRKRSSHSYWPLCCCCPLSAAQHRHQPDAQPAAAEPAADTSQPTQDSVSAADGDTVTIGYYLPLSGANATDSPYYLNAINLAIKKINAEGGLNGKQIVTASYDTTSSTEEAAKVATKLVTVDKISICISSPMSSEVLARPRRSTTQVCSRWLWAFPARCSIPKALNMASAARSIRTTLSPPA